MKRDKSDTNRTITIYGSGTLSVLFAVGAMYLDPERGGLVLLALAVIYWVVGFLAHVTTSEETSTR